MKRHLLFALALLLVAPVVSAWTWPDWTDPQISVISSPVHHSTIVGTVTVSAEITDNRGVVSAVYRVDGGATVAMWYAGGTTWQGSLDTTAFADGRHRIQVLAYDAAGNDASESVYVTFNNTGGWGETALDRYIYKYDPNYTYENYYTKIDFGYTTYFIDMKSQQWRSPEEVDRCIWQHDMKIIVPWDCPGNSTAVLLVDGGSNRTERPTDVDQEYVLIALATCSVFVQLRQVPNEPLYFADEVDRRRSEDEILAYSLDKALVTGDEEWPVHLAMVKSVVRAMDTVQTFLPTKMKWIDDFVVLGFSKRGWTTWLTAGVDDRIKAILPGSIDILNIKPQLDHHWEAYGFYAPAIDDYVEFDIFCRMGSPEGMSLLNTVDPYAYRARYTMPKMILNSSGDQFFLPDSSQFYFDGLPGRKVMRYTINTDHSQSTEIADLLPLVAWAWDILEDNDDPAFAWSLEPDGSIRVECYDQPVQVKLWQATNPNARDFRLEVIGPVYTSTVLTDQGGGVYVGSVPTPAQGWTCFTVELTYDWGNALTADRIYTTDMRVVPDTLPFAGTHCME